MIHAAAARLTRRTQAAATLRRTAHARHAFDFDAFTDDVMVLDLARMRASAFSEQALPLVEAIRAPRPRGAALPHGSRPRDRPGAVGDGADAHAACAATG